MTRYIYILLFFIAPTCLFSQSLKVGDKAPEIVQTGLNGEELKLSSLKGQMVLIDFWASWCGPCRRENPTIVKAYLKYKDEKFTNGDGFTIFSVSMDMKRDSWEKAIIADKLEWPYHVSDLRGWANAASKKYNIRQVPYSYLVDGDGIIVAINPRGDKLADNLKEFKKSGFFFGGGK